MNTVKEMVFTLCLVSLAAGVFRMLAPRGAMQRVAITVMGLFTLVCFLSPFTGTVDFSSVFSVPTDKLIPSSGMLTQNFSAFEQAAVAEVTATVEAIAGQQELEVMVTRVKVTQQQDMFLVEALELTLIGTQQQAEQMKAEILEVVKCEVVVTWTKKEK